MPAVVSMSEITELLERVAVLEERTDTIEKEVSSMSDDVRAIRDVVVGAKGFWAVIIGTVTFLAALGGIVLAVLPLFHKS